jgi:hypothetical protein
VVELAERVRRGEIKALSIRQPWCHHILFDGKDVENRDWPTRGRGWFLVHASKSEAEDRELIRQKNMPLGGIVGIARIVDCVEQMDSEWFCGRYGFVLRDAAPLPFVPCKGALGFFALSEDVRAAVADAMLKERNRHD